MQSGPMGDGGGTATPPPMVVTAQQAAKHYQDMRVMRAMVAGGVLGGLESLTMYPSIYVKTQLQLDYGRSFFGYKLARFALLKVGATDILRMYKGPMDCIRKTYAARGVAGFYTGCLMTVTASVPKVGVRFATTEAVLGHLRMDERGNHTLAQRLFAGTMGAILETILIGAPMETVMTQMIRDSTADNPKLKGAVHAFSYILLKHGVAGLYRGTTSIVVRQMFTQWIRMAVYESGQNAYRVKRPGQDMPLLLVAGLGAISGFISVVITAPIEIVKTRMQGLFWSHNRSHWACARKLWRKEGATVFFRGTAPRMIRVCIDMTYNSIFYELMISYMEKRWK